MSEDTPQRMRRATRFDRHKAAQTAAVGQGSGKSPRAGEVAEQNHHETPFLTKHDYMQAVCPPDHNPRTIEQSSYP